MRGETTEARGVKTRAMAEALGRAGFGDLGAYFRARAMATFAAMSREMGVSGETVRRWYREWSGAGADCS